MTKNNKYGSRQGGITLLMCMFFVAFYTLKTGIPVEEGDAFFKWPSGTD